MFHEKRLSITILISLVGPMLYNQTVLANIPDQSQPIGANYIRSIVRKNDNDSLPICVQADEVKVNHSGHATFSGNVKIKQGDSIISAKKIELIQQSQEKKENTPCVISATGNISYCDGKIKLQGPKALVDLDSKDINIYYGNYCFLDRPGHGAAYFIKHCKNNHYTVLKNGSFTSCAPENEIWTFVGSEVIYDYREQIAKIRNAYLKFGKIPIFYSPYFQIPIGNKRHSGLLIPSIAYSSKNGIEFKFPYYLNLAPNYDVTFTPNYMAKRGTQIQTEFRYLSDFGKGLTKFDYLSGDRIYKNIHKIDNNNKNRWILYWQHDGIMNRVWRFNADCYRVSDTDYINDFSSKYYKNGRMIDTKTAQKICFGFSDQNWNSVLSYVKFQTFNAPTSDRYRSAPQFDLIYHKDELGPFSFKLFGQLAQFTHVNNNHPKTVRLYVEPTIGLPLINYWGNLNAEAKLVTLYYQQDNTVEYNKRININQFLKKSASCVIPKFKTDGRIIIERNTDRKTHYIHTIEPRLQYLYIPYGNQNNISIYDSNILRIIDYYGLFRDPSYNYFNRILSTNRLAAGVSTRIYNDQNIEQFSASIGQIYNFSKSHIESNVDIRNSHSISGRSNMLWVGDSYWRISDNEWGVRGSLQYDSHFNNIILGNAMLEYQRDKNHALQLNYRYANSQYIEQLLSDTNKSGHQKSISQIGITGNWPLIDSLSLVGEYYFNGKTNQVTNRLIGLQYNTCCLAMNLDYERKIIGWNKISHANQLENKVSFNIELRGLKTS
ncbi:LPS assembly protein LptD [Sodalis sp. CWE]|uniref:LPS assembly protein LptD n=1 Tax=Sodalis sp. CWE TaxID=2803816 RepID=UPI001C7CED4C|nr:LPS assembly protein LptD [Sodalis sp. CWE]MBX4180731.1 LPS assembly protein LptD [Sodalis sp. CWE]